MSRSPAFDAFASNTLGVVGHPVPEAYIEGLHGLTRGRVKVNASSVRGYVTNYRWLELSMEDDGAVSAWVVAPVEFAGRVVEITVYVGSMSTPTALVRLLQQAKALIAEVISGGSHIATLLGEGITEQRQRVLLYSAPGADPTIAAARYAAFVKRNAIELPKQANLPANDTKLMGLKNKSAGRKG
jgi:hypothetical protein